VQAGYVEGLQRESRLLQDAAGYSPFYREGDYTLTTGSGPERVTGVPITCNLLPLLGVEPSIGRGFSADECRWQGPPAVLLSHGLWVRRFGADPGVVGRSLTLTGRALGQVNGENGQTTMVVGVLPASFDLINMVAPGTAADFYRPFPLAAETDRMGNTLALIGRVVPGADVEAVQAEVAALAGTLVSTLPSGRRNTLEPRVRHFREQVSGRFRRAVYVLAAAVSLVMLIVCANLSNLLLARSAARTKEIAVRAALGADRRRLITQLLTESVLLAAMGGVVGLGLAALGTRLLAALEAPIPLLSAVRLDPVALVLALGLSLAVGLTFGVLPALRLSATVPGAGLARKSRGSSGDRTQRRLLGSLVVAQVALACVLLVGAGLLGRSLVHLLEVDLGYQPKEAVAVRVDPAQRIDDVLARTAYYDGVLDQVRSVPTIRAAGLIDVLPFGFNRRWTVAVRERASDPHAQVGTFVRLVSDGYLSAMGIAVVAGRDIAATDTANTPPVALVNEVLARALWPGERAVGRVLTTGGVDREVVGVVRATRHQALDDEPGAEVYFAFRQLDDYADMYLVAHGPEDAAVTLGGVRGALARVAPDVATNDARFIEHLVQRTLTPQRLILGLLGGFAAFALLLAAFGIYGMIVYVLAQRRKEFGIRLALGESPCRLRRRVLARIVALAGTGVVIGLAASWPATQLMRGLLYAVTPGDPVTFVAIASVLLLAATAAGYVPVRAAARGRVLDALRED